MQFKRSRRQTTKVSQLKVYKVRTHTHICSHSGGENLPAPFISILAALVREPRPRPIYLYPTISRSVKTPFPRSPRIYLSSLHFISRAPLPQLQTVPDKPRGGGPVCTCKTYTSLRLALQYFTLRCINRSPRPDARARFGNIKFAG